MSRLLSFLLLGPPVVNAAMAAYMASVPLHIRALVDANECTLPSEFTISDFSGQSDDGGDTLDQFEFNFQNDGTSISTLCQFNSSSEAIILGGRTPRYACNDPSVHFIWQDSALTMIEKVCPDEQGYVQLVPLAIHMPLAVV